MSAAQRILPVSVLDGKYALLLELGYGATGTVYEAKNLRIGKKIALRLMNPAIFTEQDSQARFMAELRKAARISHANVVDIYDLGISKSGVPYIVMERLRGETLQDLIDMRGPLALGDALALFLQLLAGLSAAHAQGIVHSDLKPANALVTRPRSGRQLVKLLDFGVARGVEAAHRVDPVVTCTPMFMAPEQVMGEPADFRSDVYQACATLFAMLGGTHPFEAQGSTRDLLRLVAQGQTKDLKQLAPELPVALVTIIKNGMAVQRQQRIQSAEELAESLRPFLSAPARLVALVPSASTPPPLIVRPEAARAKPAPAVVIPVRMPPAARITDSLLVSPRIPRAPGTPKLRPGQDFTPLLGNPDHAQPAGARRKRSRAPRQRRRRLRHDVLSGLVAGGIGVALGVALALSVWPL